MYYLPYCFTNPIFGKNLVTEIWAKIFFFRNQSLLMGKVIKNKRGLELITNWEEWPSGLRRCDQNRKVPGSNPTRRSAGLRDPTSLRGSR